MAIQYYPVSILALANQSLPSSKKPHFCFVKHMTYSLFSNLTMLVGKSVRVKYLPYLKTLLDTKLLGGGDGEEVYRKAVLSCFSLVTQIP